MSAFQSNRPKRIPTSRAYWELKAEQVMNRVFQAEAPIEVRVVESHELQLNGDPIASDEQQGKHSGLPAQIHTSRLTKSFLGAALATAGIMAGAIGIRYQEQQTLRQERNLLLIERLRSLSGPAETYTPQATGKTVHDGNGAELPPPPPEEPWMQELGSLPQSNKPEVQVLSVPMSQSLSKPTTAITPAPVTGTNPEAPNIPQLVGIIHSPGKGESAIFQLGGGSTSAAMGEVIGNSGWRLRSARGDSAVIEKNGSRKVLTINGGF